MRGYRPRRGSWYFSWDVDTQAVLLFDVEADPRRENDLAADHPDLVGEFKARIEEWRKTHET